MKKILLLIVPVIILFIYLSYYGANEDVFIIPIEGTPGVSANEGFEKLFDNDTNTRWSVKPFKKAYALWELSEPVIPAGYIIITSDNTSKNKGCLPECWTLYASDAAEVPEIKAGNWTELVRVENDTVLNSGDLSERYFYINCDKEYRYYLLVIDRVESGDVMQLAEFSLQYMGYDYSYRPTGTRPHTTKAFTTSQHTTSPVTTVTDPYSTTEHNKTTNPIITTTSAVTGVTSVTDGVTQDNLEEMAARNSKCYFYNFLDDNEKTVYNQICLAAESYVTSITAPAADVTSDTMHKIYNYLMDDHPEYFWLDKFSWRYNGSTQLITSIDMIYCYAQSEIPSLKQRIDSEVGKICAGLTAESSDYEVLLAAFEGIIELVDYDTLTLEATEGEENADGEPDELRNLVGTFVNKKVVCVGYAKALQYILQKYGIESACINNEDHSWNLVKIDGDYYYVDATWGDASNTDPDRNEDIGIKYGFMCMTTEELETLDSHDIPDDVPVPECTATEYDYFVQNDLMFDYYDTDKLQELFDESFAAGGAEFDLKCADESTYEEIMADLFDDGTVWDYINSSVADTGATKPDLVWNVTDERLFTIKIYYTY